MGAASNQTYGNPFCPEPCTVYQSGNQIARERSVYSRFTNHYSPEPNGMYYCIVYVNNERIEQQRLVISK